MHGCFKWCESVNLKMFRYYIFIYCCLNFKWYLVNNKHNSWMCSTEWCRCVLWTVIISKHEQRTNTLLWFFDYQSSDSVTQFLRKCASFFMLCNLQMRTGTLPAGNSSLHIIILIFSVLILLAFFIFVFYIEKI